MNITDEFLLKSYFEAIKLKLDNDFIELLKKEINSRNLDINHQQNLLRKTSNQ